MQKKLYFFPLYGWGWYESGRNAHFANCFESMVQLGIVEVEAGRENPENRHVLGCIKKGTPLIGGFQIELVPRHPELGLWDVLLREGDNKEPRYTGHCKLADSREALQPEVEGQKKWLRERGLE